MPWIRHQTSFHSCVFLTVAFLPFYPDVIEQGASDQSQIYHQTFSFQAFFKLKIGPRQGLQNQFIKCFKGF